MGIFCKVCLSVGEGHDKEQLCVIGGGGASLFRRTVSSWSRRPDSATLKWGRAWCVQKMGRETKNTEKLGRRVNQSPWQSAGQKARVQMLFLTAKSKQRKGRKGNFCKASRSSLERVRCSKLQVSGASRKFREKAVLALQIPSAQVRFFFFLKRVSSLVCTQWLFRSLSPAPPQQEASCKDIQKTTLEGFDGLLAGSEQLSTGSWHFIYFQI